MSAAPAPTIVWFRDDLRVADNPALAAAAARGGPIVPLYVLDEATAGGGRPLGSAARWWLAGSLAALSRRLAGLGAPLVLRRGPAAEIVPSFAREIGAGAVHWNRRYHAAGIAADATVEAALKAAGVAVESHHANLLHEPSAVTTAAGDPYRVFTPFWRAVLGRDAPRLPLPAPRHLARLAPSPPGERIDDWHLTPTAPDWAGGLRAAWRPGEAAAEARLEAFLTDGLAGYADRRDVPAGEATSRLSPHLRFGEISPFRIWHAVAARAAADPGRLGSGAEKFQAELGWREFSWHLLHHNPGLAHENFNRRFDSLAWRASDAATAVAAWRRGLTGVPIVDAGMRALWQTGFLHNRLRMVVASFLTKHLLVDWRVGEAWFWDTLVDADAAANPAGWQWVAGCGADAAPYFRIFNPVLQGEKFDPGGAYVRRFVPEIAGLPDRFLHRPWEAPAAALAEAGLRLGDTYPAPIVDLADARERALAAYERAKAA